MKVKQISEHIWSLKTWMIIPIHVWLVADEDGVTLVDAGIPMMAKGIVKTIEKIQKGPLERILLTHGHSDHTGSVKPILNTVNVPVYAHQIEIPFIEGERPYPGRKKAGVTVEKHVTQPLPMDKQGGLTPYHTPGHSPGHIVYYHEQDQVLLGGDLFTSKRGNLKRPMPMFTADMKEAINSSLILEELNPKHLEVCHGEPVAWPAEQLEAYLQKNGAVSE